MKIIVEHDGSEAPPRYYKHCDGRPIFGEKRDAARVDGSLAEKVVEQLHALNHKNCRLMDEAERFKRTAKAPAEQK